MTEEEYLKMSALTLAEGEMHENLVPSGEVDFMLHAAKVATDWCDSVKRGLFYGKGAKLRTSFGTSTSLQLKPELKNLIHGIVGAFGEAGEMMDHLHDVLTSRVELDSVNLLEEIGDLEWYLACIHRALGTTPSQAWDVNIAKLAKRYPGMRWDAEAAVNRDLDVERATLEERSVMPSPYRPSISSAHGRVDVPPADDQR